MRKALLIILIIAAALTLGFFGLNSYIRNRELSQNVPVERYEATLSGTYVCLPHLNQDGPQTLECAFGLETDSGEYYGLDFNGYAGGVPPENLQTGDRFTAEGIITPIEMLSADYWQRYDIQGIFSVSEEIQIIN